MPILLCIVMFTNIYDPLEKYLETVDRMDDPDKILLTQAQILPRFLQNATEQIVKEFEMA